MKRVMFLTRSARDFCDYGYHAIGDFDGDGLLEMAYNTGSYESMSTDPQRWEIGRFLPFNRWQLLHADTIIFPPPDGIQPGYFTLGAFDVADHDGLHLPELLGWDYAFYDAGGGDTTLLCMRQNRFPGDLPFTLSWDTAVAANTSIKGPVYLPGSLNFNNRTDIPCWFFYSNQGPHDTAASIPAILENTGNDRYRTIWTWPEWFMTQDEFGFGDFNLDSVTEMVGADLYWDGLVRLWEATNDRNFALKWRDSLALPNAAHQIFTGHDPYQGGKPEFFVGPARCEGGDYWFCYLYRYEATGGNAYVRVPVDSCERCVLAPAGVSMCADLDGSGVEDIVWNTARSLEVGEYGDTSPISWHHPGSSSFHYLRGCRVEREFGGREQRRRIFGSARRPTTDYSLPCQPPSSQTCPALTVAAFMLRCLSVSSRLTCRRCSSFSRWSCRANRRDRLLPYRRRTGETSCDIVPETPLAAMKKSSSEKAAVKAEV